MNNAIIIDSDDEKNVITLGKRKFDPVSSEEEPKKKKRKITDTSETNKFSYINPNPLYKNNDFEMQKLDVHNEKYIVSKLSEGYPKTSDEYLEDYKKTNNIDFYPESLNAHPISKFGTNIISISERIVVDSGFLNNNNNTISEYQMSKKISNERKELERREQELERREQICKKKEEENKNRYIKCISFVKELEKEKSYLHQKYENLTNLELKIELLSSNMKAFVQNYRKHCAFINEKDEHTNIPDLKDSRIRVSNAFILACHTKGRYESSKSYYNGQIIKYLYKENQKLRNYIARANNEASFVDFHVKKILNIE